MNYFPKKKKMKLILNFCVSVTVMFNIKKWPLYDPSEIGGGGGGGGKQFSKLSF